jgi:hypothetical protein
VEIIIDLSLSASLRPQKRGGHQDRRLLSSYHRQGQIRLQLADVDHRDEPAFDMRESTREGEMSTQPLDGVARLNQIYEQYVKPVEQDHQGEYVVVTPDGRLIFAPSLDAIAKKADEMPRTGNFLFKVGEISAAKIL